MRKTSGRRSSAACKARPSLRAAAGDYRVWLLFTTYAACFGVELTIQSVGAVYFVDDFSMGITTAGAIVACFGLSALFARALGGVAGIIGAGGNFGAVAACFLIKGACTTQHALFLLGASVAARCTT
jgi:nitrate/nitrite transporter NarK